MVKSIGDFKSHAEMVASLPPYVRAWIESDLERDLHEIKSFEFGPGDRLSRALQHNRYRFNFFDGSFELKTFTIFNEDCQGEVHIPGFRELVPPNLWLHRHIMERPDGPTPEILRYQDTLVAYSLIGHLAKRDAADPLLRRVAQKLVQDESAEEAPAMALQMECFANAYTASQICTAAYQAWHELEREQFCREFERTRPVREEEIYSKVD